LERAIDVSLIEDNIKRYEKEIEKKREQKSPYLLMVGNDIAAIEKAKEEIIEVEEAIVKIEKDVELNNFWLKAFSSQGIQSYVLDSITKVLNGFIADYLMHLSDGRISARLNTVKLLKSGEYRDNFGVDIVNMDGGNTYASLSGGAKKRVDLAMSLAISKFVMATQGRELKFIVFDEATVGMDDHWTTKFIEMIIEKFKGYSLWYITHQPVDFFYFDNVVTVVKQGGETKIKEA
jgi:DNA repair exonuclease SbcCD ATPase subunit